MAKLSDLVAVLAESTEIPETTIKEVARKLREHRLIRTGKGGRYGGAQMTPDDAAALIIGLMAYRASGSSLHDLAPITRELLRGKSHNSKLRPGGWPRELNLPLLSKLGPAHSLNDAVVALIASSIRGGLADMNRDEEILRVFCPPKHPFASIGFDTRARGSSVTRTELNYSRSFPIPAPSLTVIANLVLGTIGDIADVLRTPAEG